MNTRTAVRLRTVLAVLALGAAGLSGCATHRVSEGDPQLLEFLMDGTTTREEIVLKLGAPSATFEQERILTYRLGGDEKQGYIIRTPPPNGVWVAVHYSLVLVLDGAGTLKKHSLVPVQ